MAWPKGKPRSPETLRLMQEVKRANKERRHQAVQTPLPAKPGLTSPPVGGTPPQAREDHAVAYALPAVTVRARKAERKVYALLEEFFDVDLGLYRHQYSDLKVAEETELSEHAVVVIRKSAFGELRPLDPQIAVDLAKVKRDAEDLSSMLNEVWAEVKRLESKLLSLN